MSQISTPHPFSQKNNFSSRFSVLLNKIPREIKYILLLFILTRFILTFVGISSRYYLKDKIGNWYEWNYSKITALDIWSVWDSGWYLDIAQNGYSPILRSDLPKKVVQGQSNIGFFPLYPILIKITKAVIKDYYISALLVSNLSLILSSIFLYKLVENEYGRGAADKSAMYLFLFPTAFVLSGIFSESVFLLLSIVSFYYANKNKWLKSSLAGFLLSLTRPTGFLISIPLVILYLQRKRFNSRLINRDIVYPMLIPLGLILFMTYTYILTGDFFAYFHLKASAWGSVISNPFVNFLGLFVISPATRIIGIFILLILFLMILSVKKISAVYVIFTLLLILSTLTSGIEIAIGLSRMSAAFFPIFIALAKIKLNPLRETFLVIFLIAIQITFMAFWSNGILII